MLLCFNTAMFSILLLLQCLGLKLKKVYTPFNFSLVLFGAFSQLDVT